MTAPTRRRLPPVLPAGPRLAARAQAERRDRRRRLLRRVSVAALALVPVLLLSWALLASPLLSVRTVQVTTQAPGQGPGQGTAQASGQVTGQGRLADSDVRAAAGVPHGTPLAGLDTAGVRARVLALPDVARVRVVRAWPQTLRLVVTERVAVAAVGRGDGTWALADASGALFGPAAARPPGLPEVRPDGAGALPGAALQVLAELPGALRGQVAAVRQDGTSSVVLELQDGRAVVWGTPGDAARKTAVVAALLAQPGRTLDVTSPGVAVVRQAPPTG